MLYRLFFLYFYVINLIGLTKGKTVITHPSVTPVYLKAGDDLDLLCQQYNGFTVNWSRKTFNTRHYELLESSSDTGFLQHARRNGVNHLRLTKKNVQLSDSGSYKCAVHHGRDLPYAVDVFVLQIQNITGPIVQAGNHTDLQCSMLDSTFKPSVIWFKDGFEVARSLSPFHSSLLFSPPPPVTTTKTYSYAKFLLNTSYAEESTDSVLTVRNIGENDVGEYICQFLVSDERHFNQSVFLYSYPQIKSMGRSHNTVEGRLMKVECKAWGWPAPSVLWARSTDPNGAPLVLSEGGRVSFEEDNHTLLVAGVRVDDRAYYTCIATSLFNASLQLSTSESILVRVRGRFAPLVPLVGIVLEFVGLCLIIYVYEKRKKVLKADREALELKQATAQTVAEKQAISPPPSTRDPCKNRKPYH